MEVDKETMNDWLSDIYDLGIKEKLTGDHAVCRVCRQKNPEGDPNFFNMYPTCKKCAFDEWEDYVPGVSQDTLTDNIAREHPGSVVSIDKDGKIAEYRGKLRKARDGTYTTAEGYYGDTRK